MLKYYVVHDETENVNDAIKLQLRRDIFTGEEDFEKTFKSTSSIERDLLTIGAAVLAADRGTKRGERENLARRIEISIPIINASAIVPLTRLIEEILRTLSNDSWRIFLRQIEGKPESFDCPEPITNGKTLLFSGGLDSLAAAVKLIISGEHVQLVSHITRNQPSRQAQINLVKKLRSFGIIVPHHQFFVSSKADTYQSFDHDVETSQRTRSFLFLILAALVARRTGHREIVLIAENGQMAIHLPLTNGRIGAFSTHTAHPDVLNQMELFLSQALNIPFKIRNPFIDLTKAEVIKDLVRDYPELIPISESCWKNTRLSNKATHCGECIPCYIRRIAIEYWGKDDTRYARDPWIEDPPNEHTVDTGRRNLIDLIEFIFRIENSSNEEIMNEWPELYSTNIDSNVTIQMYRRFASEARTVLERCPKVRGLLT